MFVLAYLIFCEVGHGRVVQLLLFALHVLKNLYKVFAKLEEKISKTIIISVPLIVIVFLLCVHSISFL